MTVINFGKHAEDVVSGYQTGILYPVKKGETYYRRELVSDIVVMGIEYGQQYVTTGRYVPETPCHDVAMVYPSGQRKSSKWSTGYNYPFRKDYRKPTLGYIQVKAINLVHLHDVGSAEMLSSGVLAEHCDMIDEYGQYFTRYTDGWFKTPDEAYRRMWDAQYGDIDSAWDANPLCWTITFERHKIFPS